MVAAHSASASAADRASLVREQKTVMVNGSPEIWRLQWESKPTTLCGAEDAEMSLTCPCSGFAYGEQGKLALIRIRADGSHERLELGSLFQKDSPVLGMSGGSAVLQRWAPRLSGPEQDLKHAADDKFSAEVETRPLADVMQFGDYDHDGQSTEFPFQVSTMPCGKHQMVLVGLSKANPHLHIFSSVEKPETPLVLGVWVWDALLKSNDVDIVDWPCGDHGSDYEDRVHLQAGDGLLHAERRSRHCSTNELQAAPFDSTPRP
jgi:hypothetical protein